MGAGASCEPYVYALRPVRHRTATSDWQQALEWAFPEQSVIVTIEAFVMQRETFQSKAYLKEGCPYSFKYLLFMTEAGLLDQIHVIRCDPESAQFDDVKRKLSKATGRGATFPTVEIAPQRYLSDSDKLIAHYASASNIDPGRLPALSFYNETLLPQLATLQK